MGYALTGKPLCCMGTEEEEGFIASSQQSLHISADVL